MNINSDIKTQNAEAVANDASQLAVTEPESADIERQMNIMADVLEAIGQSHCNETSTPTEIAVDKLKRAERGLIMAMTDYLAKMPPDENRVRLHYYLSQILLLIQTSSFHLEGKA